MGSMQSTLYDLIFKCNQTVGLDKVAKRMIKTGKKTEKFSIFNIQEKYDLEKLSTKHIELIEIASKYAFYKKRYVRWHLRPFYELIYLLTSFEAERELSFPKKN